MTLENLYLREKAVLDDAIRENIRLEKRIHELVNDVECQRRNAISATVRMENYRSRKLLVHCLSLVVGIIIGLISMYVAKGGH